MASDDPLRQHRVVAAAIVNGSRVLLCHRHPSRTWYPNVWDLPGGHIEDAESPLDAIVRELREELGIEVNHSCAVSILRYTPTPDLEFEVWAFDTWSGAIVNAAPAEHDQIGWFGLAELSELDLADVGVATACREALGLFDRLPPG